jgi:hypothetical protein
MDQWKAMPWQMGAGNAVLIGHKMYACGGFGSKGDGTTSKCGIYDPNKDSWSKMANMPQGRNHAAYGTDGEKYYIMTGRGKNNGDTLGFSLGFDTVQIYDPKTNKWESSDDKKSWIQPSPVPRAGVTVAVYYQGEFWLIGGSSKQDAPNACIKLGPNYLYYRTDIYNIATNTWREGPDMHFTAGATTPVIDREEMKIYLPGGAVRENKSQPGETFQVLDLKLAVTLISPNPSLNENNEYVPPPDLCDEHNWKDTEAICGDCKVLASNMRDQPYFGRCDNYCESHHRRCVGAWEELGNSCVVKNEGKCDQPFGYTNDVICECSVELDACLAAPCGENTDCVDVKDGPKTEEGRTCSCKSGYEGDPNEKCTDIDACKDHPCMDNATCVDHEGESNTEAGRTCLCHEGYKMNEATMTCENIDVCESYPCAGSDTADCEDIEGGSESEEGRTCTCYFGTENYNEESGCLDIDACIHNPCGDHAICEDLTESPDDETGRICSCEVGYEGEAQDGCTDVDACLIAKCGYNAVCTDIAGGTPDVDGRECSCLNGYEGDAADGCTDIDACTVTPCTGEHVSCYDIEASVSTSDGRTCECNPGYENYSDNSGCLDINACIDNPCGTNAQCIDLNGKENNNNGRTCSCLEGYEGNPENECKLKIVKISNEVSIASEEEDKAAIIAEVIGQDDDSDDPDAATIASGVMATYLLSLIIVVFMHSSAF